MAPSRPHLPSGHSPTLRGKGLLVRMVRLPSVEVPCRCYFVKGLRFADIHGVGAAAFVSPLDVCNWGTR